MNSRFASAVGRAGKPATYEIERGHIRRFAEAIGDDNPLYHDLAAAKAAGHPDLIAPPTFAMALRPDDPRNGLEIDWKKLLHGEQSFVYAQPIYSGTTITVVCTIVAAEVKTGKSGAMDILVLETIGKNSAGKRVFVATNRSVIRA